MVVPKSGRADVTACAAFLAMGTDESHHTESQRNGGHSMLQALELSKSYGSRVALSGLNLSVAPGEIVCLLGANGAGKSTTLKLFLNLIRPSSGSVRIDGLDPAVHPARTRSLLGFIPEQVALYPRLSGLENLRYFASLAGGPGISSKRLEDALVQAGLPLEALQRRAGSYSKGMRQKVVIALSLVRSVRALLLDEPTSGLDPRSAHDFSQLLRQLASEGLAILMTSHDLSHARDSATRIGLMRQGVLVESFAADEVTHGELQQRVLQQRS